MKIEIKVTATDLMTDDLILSKRFVTFVNLPDGSRRTVAHEVSFAEERILDSIDMRIRHDRDKLIKWDKGDDYISAQIVIIPAIDYIPE